VERRTNGKGQTIGIACDDLSCFLTLFQNLWDMLGNKVIIAGRREEVLDQTTDADPGIASAQWSSRVGWGDSHRL